MTDGMYLNEPEQGAEPETDQRYTCPCGFKTEGSQAFIDHLGYCRTMKPELHSPEPEAEERKTTRNALHSVKIDASYMADLRAVESQGVIEFAVLDTGGKVSKPIYIAVTPLHGGKAKTFALTITQNGFVKVERID